MGTSKAEIAECLVSAKSAGAKYLIMVCDTFSYEDYGVRCMDSKECLEKIDHYDGKNMQRVEEVYDLSMDLDAQLAERRAYHPPSA